MNRAYYDRQVSAEGWPNVARVLLVTISVVLPINLQTAATNSISPWWEVQHNESQAMGILWCNAAGILNRFAFHCAK